MTLLHDKFLHQEKKTSCISIPKISIYLFKHFYFFHLISTQFADFASLTIQMQITFAKSFNVLKLWKIYSRAVPLQQTNNIVWFLAHLFDFSPSVVHLTLFPLFFITQNSNTHIKSKNQNTKRRTETKNIPYFWIKKS